MVQVNALDTQALGTAATYRQLIEAAAAAASSHNTQPWRFHVDADHARIAIRPDRSRRCPVVDPDDHHLWASLGCASENLAAAAASHGLRAHIAHVPGTDGGYLRATMAMDGVPEPALAQAIRARQCTRALYDGRQPSTDVIDALADHSCSARGGIIVITDPRRMQVVADYVASGDRVQLADAAFVDELLHWVRFTKAEAERTRDGLWSRACGRPAVPRWLVKALRRVVFAPGTQVALDRSHIRSSAGIAVFTSHEDAIGSWIDAGRRYERFALDATMRGLSHAFVNPPIEVPTLRTQFAHWLGLGRGRVDFIVRFGYGPPMPRSLRRPVDDIVDA
jgi:nitroreductase